MVGVGGGWRRGGMVPSLFPRVLCVPRAWAATPRLVLAPFARSSVFLGVCAPPSPCAAPRRRSCGLHDSLPRLVIRCTNKKGADDTTNGSRVRHARRPFRVARDFTLTSYSTPLSSVSFFLPCFWLGMPDKCTLRRRRRRGQGVRGTRGWCAGNCHIHAHTCQRVHRGEVRHSPARYSASRKSLPSPRGLPTRCVKGGGQGEKWTR